MLEKNVVVALDPGLQARPAAQFVQKANSFSSEIFIEKDTKRINAKSIMGLMSLALPKGSEIKIIADGPDDQEALHELIEFIKGNKK
ncbi:catabolite repression HPr-like protein Crh [Gracilibacillus boraciitolerans JCM 21714]|uniref:Catabolite repression HPr-like protein Crh n=1 Tax=Gracilibacillus boraciitolerans JCM 21714 TaxID=1298598 RepID=W4VIX0_9BACI|nr:HPr family phosphocarrier protein [Gracilibacillus boraciitolerans]GAE92763.1 catabolite repression HPr-like protein Crh [Gracilibacillus boraciitolerans JCM 21714]